MGSLLNMTLPTSLDIILVCVSTIVLYCISLWCDHHVIIVTVYHYISTLYVTGFEKTWLPHTSDFMTLANHNLPWQYTKTLQFQDVTLTSYKNSTTKFQPSSILWKVMICQSQETGCVWKPGFFKSSHILGIVCGWKVHKFHKFGSISEYFLALFILHFHQ